MTRIMHVNDKFTDIYSYIKNILFLMVLLTVGATNAWAQTTDYSGVYCLANNNQGNFLGNGNDGNFYLCPSQEYYDAGSVSTTDNGKPFFTTYQTKQDANSLWVFEKVDGQNYYTIKLYGTNKYITVNDALTGYGKAHRKRIHLEELAELSDRNYFEITPIDVINGVSGVSISCLDKYKTGSSNKYFNPAGGNQPSYTSTNNKENPWSGGMVGFFTIGKTSGDDRGSVWFLEVPKPTITYDEETGEATITSVTGTTIRYEFDDTTPTSSSTEYYPPVSMAGHTSIKAIAVDNAHNTISGVVTLNLKEYTYHIVNQAGYVAIQHTKKQAVGKTLTNTYTSIPAAIRSPYLEDEEVTFYNNSDKAEEHIIHETPSTGTDIYVTYTKDHLSERFLHLNGARALNITINEEYIYDSGTAGNGSLSHTSSNTDLATTPYLWYLSGEDPYAIEIKNAGTNNYLGYTTPSTLLLEGSQTKKFILMSGSAAGDGANYEQMELMAATGDGNYYRIGRPDGFNISTDAGTDVQQVCAYPNSAEVTYHLIDKSGKILKSITSKSESVKLPNDWQSPLVSTYHYWKLSAFDVEDNVYTLKANPAESDKVNNITDATDLNIYVTYDVNDNFNFATTEDGKTGSTYRLQFIHGESFNQENGKDAVSTTAQKAVYPYFCGDGMFFVYGDEQWRTQLNSGASTRSRWLWFVVSPTSDPYHVKIMSNQLNAKPINTGRGYFRTFSVTYKDRTTNEDVTRYVTTLTTKEEAAASVPPTEYMVLTGADGHCKLVTIINDERCTVNSLEQYWKNNPTVQNKLGGSKVTDTESYSDNIILTPQQEQLLPEEWHTYQALVNSAPWVGWKTDNTGTGRQYKNKNHWFQTVNMSATEGSDGEFEFVETTLQPQVILIDNHGWEIMRKPLYDKDGNLNTELKLYDSPMVETYHWYPTSTKVDGYHKYTVDEDDAIITVYYKNAAGKWVPDGNTTTFSSKTLYDDPYVKIKNEYQEQDASVKTDFYVTYDVKPGYARLYSGAATEAGVTASAFLVKQGNKYAKISDSNTLTATEDNPYSQESITNDWLWYVKPNFNIDAEMGYVYEGENGEKSKDVTEAEYVEAGKNGFDPYNVQIQSVANEYYYFKTNTTGSQLINGAWTGTSTDLSLKNMSVGRQLNVEGYDQTTLTITNATFMAVKDASDRMLLMPRFDHTKVVNSFTDTQLSAPNAATQSLDLLMAPKIIHSSDEFLGTNGQYTLADDFTFEDGFTSLGSETNPFTGSIDGGLHKLTGLSVPLVAYADGAILKNIVLDLGNVTISNAEDVPNVGAIVANASGETRVYNCGILSGSVSGTGNVGSIVGNLDGSSRVINCYSYANVTGTTNTGGIVGYNAYKSSSTDIQTMVMNCMFYGDVTGGKVSPIYGGEIIDNLKINNSQKQGLNNYNYYAYEKATSFNALKDNNSNKVYNNALAMEDRFLTRFEIYRQLLNSNRRLAAYYATSSSKDVTAKDMMKWVLETADRTIDSPKPYPVLKAQAKYPSIINYDVEHAPSSGDRNTGCKLGETLTVNISGTNITTSQLTIDRTDKDFDRFNFNYDKVQLPYYNDVGTGNYIDNKVVTGWKITSMSPLPASDPYTSDNYPSLGVKDYPDHNYADRKSVNKDLFGVSGRVFSQGAYFDVPYGVTEITIEPYWGTAAYVADEYLDVVYDAGWNAQSVTQLGRQYGTNGTSVNINGSNQNVYTSISEALKHLSGSTVYDNAVVLVGNLHQNAIPSAGDKPFTIMSVDLDKDNEPDYSYIYSHGARAKVSPIRFDFINVPGTAQAQKPRGATQLRNAAIFNTIGWFELTNTALMYFSQIEYENNNQTKDAPMILQGGVVDQFVSTVSHVVNGRTIYIHVGGNVWFKSFTMGTHGDGSESTPHVPVSVTGGDYDSFYLTGMYNSNAKVRDDNAECYISGGRFGELAGAGQEQIGKTGTATNGNVRWQIYNADISEFYGGGINEAKPVQGDILTDIFYSYVDKFCGGPKFGNMAANKTVTTNATGCTFGKYFGAGNGGNSYSRKKYYDKEGAPTESTWSTLEGYYTGDKGKFYDGNTTGSSQVSGKDYGKKGYGVATDFEYEFFVWTTGTAGVRIYVNFASFSLAQCNDVNSTLTNCIINQNFYGGGNLGSVVGKATSILDGCTVHGNVFGGGYSAELPTIPVRSAGFTKYPNFNANSGMFEPGVFSGTTDYEWKHVESDPGNGTAGTDGEYVKTKTNLSALGQVANTELTVRNNCLIEGGVFGGGDESAVNQNTQVNIENVKTSGDTQNTISNVFGGGNVANVGGTTTVNVESGTVSQRVFGGGNEADVNTDANVVMSGGTVLQGVYGGCNTLGTIGGNTSVTLTGGTVGTNSLPDAVFGGGLGEPTLVNGNVTVNVGTLEGSTYTGNANIHGNVYGGSALGNTSASGSLDALVFDATKTTNVYLYAGTINGNVFGGGLGRKYKAPVAQQGTEGESGYVPAQSEVTAVESFVGGDVNVLLDGAKVQQIFGCNNLNGTPKGHVKVHVKRTKNFSNAENADAYKNDNTTALDARTTYDVEAVYGGGNQADYNPTKATGTEDDKKEAFAEVLIEGCAETSIEYVYGGGNAAAVPATQVTVKSAYIIHQLFGGGNGKSTATFTNPGANIGLYNNGATKYGTGKTKIELIGGQVHEVYGGSNTLGNVRGGTSLKRSESNDCTLKIGAIYGAGQEAPMDGDVNIILECMPEEFVSQVFGGAKNAIVNGNVSLTVTSGKFGQVFGGNNLGGSINGSITVNVYEDGCLPLMIGELYGGGYKAPYSIYGCTRGEGDTWTANESGTLNFNQETEGRAAVEVNVYSCTSIGKVFGGGYQAPVIGNTHVWVNMMKGLVDDPQHPGDRKENPIGKIARVFGGGNEAVVKGNTTLDIGTATVNIYDSSTPAEDVGVNIESGSYLKPVKDENNSEEYETLTAGIYGGGNAANVEGSTTLNIGTVNQTAGGNPSIKIQGDIFGGGYGESTLVTGNVVVNIGKKTETTVDETTTYGYEGYAIITGDVYGGSAKGKVNTTDGSSISDGSPTTQVNFYGGTIQDTETPSGKGNIYGGGLGEDNEGTENDHAADVYGPVTVTLEKGSKTNTVVNNVFGCNNVLGTPKNTVMVNINGGTVNHSVYGGGNQAAYTPTESNTNYPAVNINNGTITENVFGGGLGTTATVTGNPHVTMAGGDVKQSVYGGGSLATVDGSTNIVVNKGTIGTPKDGETVFGGAVYGNIYGGGFGSSDNVRIGLVKGNTNVTVNGGTILHNVYGGGAYGSVGTYSYGSENANAAITGRSEGAENTGKATIKIKGGSIGTNGKENGMIFGSSRGDIDAIGAIQDNMAWVYDTDVQIGIANDQTSGPTIHGSLYGGGENGHVFNDASVTMYSGTVGNMEEFYANRGNVYGGGCGTDLYYSNPTEVENPHNGNGDKYNPKAGIVHHNATVLIKGGNIANNVYGAGSMGKVEGSTSVTIDSNGSIGVDGNHDDGNVYGAARGELNLKENNHIRTEDNPDDFSSVMHSSVEIKNGTVKGNVFGGGKAGIVKGNVDVKVRGGVVKNDVYGGGALANTNTANWSTSTSATTYEEVTGLTVGTTSVAGYYTRSGEEGSYVYTLVTTGTAASETTYWRKKVSGTWDEGKNDSSTGTTYKTNVQLTGGLIGNVYGGGLGQLANGDNPADEGYKPAIAAMVYGDVKVTVNDPSVIGTDPGVAFTQDTKNITYGEGDKQKEYVIPLTGRVFGCNNQNGTPTGNVRVEVYSTRQIDANNNIIPGHGSSNRKYPNEMRAVYGGGNLSDYLPADGKGTSVYVEGCGVTSIEKVYGGGNSASVPATDVTIHSCYDIGYAFGGGNGGDLINKNGEWIENEGAIVIGLAKITPRGGKIGQVFGGSDAKGVCGNTTVDLSQQIGQECPLVLTRIYGAGNEADVSGDVNMIISGCGSGTQTIGNETVNTQIEYVYGGSYNAHITGHVNLTISSGIFKYVYGGNDRTGSIGGNITVNIEERDNCNPIIIENLLGGGNEAAYPGTKRDGTEITTAGKITVNVKSATYIGSVYGGSYKADVNGDTEVNINMTKGLWAGAQAPAGHSDLPNVNHVNQASYAKVVSPTADNIGTYYEKSGETYAKTLDTEVNSSKTYYVEVAANTDIIDDAVGVIGTVYGGGNQGVVRGSSVVNIGTSTTVPVINVVTTDNEGKITDITYKNAPVLGARITGDVFGGGNEANINKDATVNICTVDHSGTTDFEGINIEGGSVYGGGNASDVLGNTNVTMKGGYVFDGVYGGGLKGSVGTVTERETLPTGHPTHDGCLGGKPKTFKANTGKCTVVVTGGQVGPKEVALADGGMKNTARYFIKAGDDTAPVDVGFVFGAGRGDVENPATSPDADFHTFVKETDVTISGGLIMASVYGGGENGRVLNDTHVTISGGQIGCGEGQVENGKPKPYTETQWTAAATAVDSGDPAQIESAALPECASWDYTSPFLPHDPYAAATDTEDAKIGTDGHTYYGSVFGGGSGYYPYKKADGTHEWLRSAGQVYGNTVIDITGGHILTSVYGGNETTDVGTYTRNVKGNIVHADGTGKCTINMVGGTLGVPRTEARMKAHPVTCYLFGSGKGDQRTHFNTWTNVQETEVNVSGTARIFGSVFGGGEDGHILGDAKVNIGGSVTIGETTYTAQNGLKIGTTGTSYVDGNVFGGGRGFSGEALTAGSTGGNVTMNITGGTMLGSVYGGGRLASVGIGFTSPSDKNYGQLIDDTDEDEDGTIEDSERHGHVTINISGANTIIGNGTTEAGAGHPVSGNVFGGSMGRITKLDGKTRISLWPKQAVTKLSNITISGGTIYNSVYGGGEIGIVRNHATVNVSGGTIHGNVFGGGYGSDEQDKTTITAGGYDDIPTVYYTFTPMMWTGCVSGDTEVNISGGTIKKSVYGGGKFASVGLMNFNSSEDGSTYNYITKHNTTNGFGLSWPYEFQYIKAAPKDDPTIGGDKIGGKTTVKITGGRIGTTTSTDNAGFVFGGSKGQVSFNKADNTTHITDIDEQVYAEAFCANVRETEITINYASTPESDDGSTTPCIVRTVYGGGEDGHVMENAVVNLKNGWIGRMLFGGGKGTSTYKGTKYVYNGSSWTLTDNQDIHSWTAGKVYGNTTVTIEGGKVGWFVYGGGNMASVGKGNYAGGADDYSTAGYGETLTGNLWTSAAEGDNAWHFLNSGKTTVNLFGGTIGTESAGFNDDGIPYGSVFGGSRGTAALETSDVATLSPLYNHIPEYYLGYVNKTVVNVGGTSPSALSANTPTIYGSIYGGAQDGHVRNSTEVKMFKGSVAGQTPDPAGRSGHVFGAGSGIGTYVDKNDGNKNKINSSSGSVTCTTLVELNGGSIHGNIWGGGALSSVGPLKIGDKNEQHAASDSHKSYSKTQVDIKGGSVGGSVYGAGRGPGDAYYVSQFGGETPIQTYDRTKFATDIWSDVTVSGGTIGNNVYGGGQGGVVKESTTVSLTGGDIAHDAYGGGQGTQYLAADIFGNTTTELNKDKTADSNGCSVERIFGCNDLKGTPKGHVLVHVYATQRKGTTKIVPTGGKHKKFDKLSNYTTENYATYTYDGKKLSDLATEAGMNSSEISALTDILTKNDEFFTEAKIEELRVSLGLTFKADDDKVKKIKEKVLDNYIDAIADGHYDVLGVYGGGDLAMYKPYGPQANDTEADYKATTQNTEVIIDGCDLTSIKQVYGGGNAASTPANYVRINEAYELHEVFGGGNGKDAYEIDGKWYENPGANIGYYATYHHDTTVDGKGSQGNPYPAIANEDADTPDERRENTNYHYGKGTANLEITGGRIHATYGGSNTRGNVRAEAHTSDEDAGVCTMLIDATYPAGKNADTDAGSKVEAKCVDYVDAIYGGAENANVYSDVVIDITNGTYGAIYGGNNTSGKIYGSITINVHEEGCKPIVIDKLYGGGFNADYSIYGFNDDGTARTKAQYEALEDKTGITVQRDPQINIISATKIGKIYGGGFNAKLIGNPSINVNMEKGFVAARYVKEDETAGTNKFTPGDHSVTEHGMDCSYTVENKDADGKAILAIGSVGSIYGGGFKGDVQGNTSVAIGTGEWLSFTGQRETSDADGKVYTYNTTTQKWDWTKTVDETTTSGTADDKPVPARNAATITGNVFGGGEGEALESGNRAFYCESAMVGVVDDGVTHPEGGTSVVIANGTVGTLEGEEGSKTLKAGTGNVYGGGEVGRVEKNTVVTIGVTPKEGETIANTKFKPTVYGSVFGAGKGVATHGYSALVRGNSNVTIQGFAKVGECVYGGGEIASVGRYTVVNGVPTSLKDENSGNCIVKVLDNAEIGPDNMTMFHVNAQGNIVDNDEPDNSGHVFGAGKGAMPGANYTTAQHMTDNNTLAGFTSEADYLKFIETLGLATQTKVTIGGNAFVKGDIFGGAEQGFVQHDTHVIIEGNCQIGNGYVQMNDAGTYLARTARYSLNRRYTDAEWEAGHLIKDGETNYSSSLPECASWEYGQATGDAKYAAHDIYAGTTGYDSKGGSTIADNGSTFYGNVFGGGSGYFPYAPGKWHWKAGDVGGNTVVDIKGGHILTNVYGANELTNVTGKSTINMSGGTIGVPRTLGQIMAHPVTCYLFGGGKGDPRVLFNKQTNAQDVEVNVTGGWIYGSVFGGGEDGHVMRDVTMNISGSEIATTKTYAEAYADLYAGSATKIGTWGTSYVDGNVFGGGRGFSGDAYTAGNVAGSVTLNISGGTMLGSVYGGGRLGSVGYGLYAATETETATNHKMYGEMQEDGYGDWYMDGTTYKHDAIANFKRGYVTMTISGGTIGNANEFIMPNATNITALNTALSTSLSTDFKTWTSENWKTWKSYYNVPNTEYDTSNGRVTHTKGGNVYAGGMGRFYLLDGTTKISTYENGVLTPSSPIEWTKLGNVKSTKLTISGDTWIMGDVYGGGELGKVSGYHTIGGKNLGSEIIIEGGTIGTEITGTIPVKTTVPLPDGYPASSGSSSVKYTYGSVYGGGEGMEKHDDSTAQNHGGEVTNSTKVDITGDTKVRASVYGGGEMALVGGDTYVTISGGEIGRNEVKPMSDTSSPGYLIFGGATMGNVYGGGKGSVDHVNAGQVKGNTNVTIQETKADEAYNTAHPETAVGTVLSSPKVYHMVYGGGALASVGTFKLSTGTVPAYIPIAGIPYEWTEGTGTATVNITGGTIGISGRENGLVFGSSRGGLQSLYAHYTQEEISNAQQGEAAYGKTTGDVYKKYDVDPHDRVAWVKKSVVNIGTDGSTDLTTPLIKGSVYGGGENGHNAEDAEVNVYSGTIGIADKIPGTENTDPWWDFGDEAKNTQYRGARGNVYGAGSGSDYYTVTVGTGDNAKTFKYYNPKAGMVGHNTEVNIKGGHVGRNVYGGGAMAMVGTITNVSDTTSAAKHANEASSFALSWPYKFEFVNNTGKATVNVTGGHIGTLNTDGGDVFGSSRGEAGDRYATAHHAYVKETEVNINYPVPSSITPATTVSEYYASKMSTIKTDFTIPCITGSVSGSGEDGYVYGDTHVTLNEGLIGHSLYGGGKGKGTYEVTLNKIGGGGTYDADIYSLIAGKVFGNTYVTMNDGVVGRNVYGGGNMASVGKGNYASGADDYFPDGYGEKITGNLWTTTVTEANPDDAWEFLNSGKTTVNVFGGQVGFKTTDKKNNLPYGNVFGGSAGEPAPYVPDLSDLYKYCPAYFSGYVNETDVHIGGGYKCKTACTIGDKSYKVGDTLNDDQYNALASDKDKWEAITTTPTIVASVYGGGQDGHVRRDTKVTVRGGEIGMAYTSTNQTTLGTNNLDDDQWLARGNVYGGGSGISQYTSTLVYADGYTGEKVETTGYSNTAGSVTRFTQVDILGGTIHRNVYGGGSMGSVGPLKTTQAYDPYKKDLTNTTTLGKQSQNTVNIGGGTSVVTIGTPYDADKGWTYNKLYGGEVYGACRGMSSLNAEEFATSVWTKVNIFDKATIMGNVYGGGDNGMVKKDSEVIIGEQK